MKFDELKGNSIMPAIITIILLIGLFPLIYFTMTAEISENAKNMLSIMVGAYLQYTGSSVYYFVGTNFSSGTKDQMIYRSNPPVYKEKEGEK